MSVEPNAVYEATLLYWSEKILLHGRSTDIHKNPNIGNNSFAGELVKKTYARSEICKAFKK